jgi:transcriptional regulator with XRE-family HTH domain
MVGLTSRELLYQELGMSLANQRRRLHLSQSQFAAKVGLSRTSITNIECGRQPIQLHQLYLFASILQVDVAKLLPKENLLAEPAVPPDDKQARYLADAARLLTRAEKRAIGGDHGR